MVKYFGCFFLYITFFYGPLGICDVEEGGRVRAEGVLFS
jgi:hypothetical protein